MKSKERAVVQFGSSALFWGVIPNPAQFGGVRDLAGSVPGRLVSTARDPSLRLKNGASQDDAMGAETPKT